MFVSFFLFFLLIDFGFFIRRFALVFGFVGIQVVKAHENYMQCVNSRTEDAMAFACLAIPPITPLSQHELDVLKVKSSHVNQSINQSIN
jgi:TRAP-type mannitol/chloroaromatic compound transport system permease large subunit